MAADGRDEAASPVDYARLIDAETWAFIRDSESWYPPDTATAPVERQREIYDRMCRAFHRGYPPGVTARDAPVAGVPCRHYRKAGAAPAATVLYLHGGGFVVGGLDSHDDVCAEICAETGFDVVAADYRLAPEHRHPAAFDDCLAVARSVGADGRALILAGDSAGGCLAASVAHAARSGGPKIAGLVLIYPGLGGDMTAGSYLRHAQAPMLTRDDVLYYFTIRHPEGAARGTDWRAEALADTDFSGLPPALLFAAECDPLADDCAAYAARLSAAGGRAFSLTEPGLVHGYLRARRTVTRARASFGRITEAIACLGRGGWPGWARTEDCA